MFDPVEACIRWVPWGLRGLAISTLGLGLFSVWAPQRSIALYQWMMACFNWRVSPIDEARELRTTRFLGGCLVVFSVVMVWLCDSHRS